MTLKSDKLLIEIARLSRVERMQFKDFLNSPFHNKSQKLVILYECCVAHLKNPEDLEETLLKAAKKAKEDIKVAHLAVLKTRLLKLLFQYRMIDRIYKNEHLSSIQLIQTLHENGQGQDATKELDRLKKRVGETSEHGLDTAAVLAEIQWVELELSKTDYDPKKHIDQLYDTFGAVSQDHTSRLLQLIITLQAHYQRYKTKYRLDELDSLKKVIQGLDHDYSNSQDSFPNSLLKMGYDVAFENVTPTDLIASIQKSEKTLDKNIQSFLYRIATNYFTINKLYNQEFLDLLLDLLESGMLDGASGHVATADLSSIVKCYHRASRYKEATHFLKRMSNRVVEVEQNGSYLIELANCMAMTGDLPEALNTIGQAVPSNEKDYIRIKNKTIQWLYDSGLDEQCSSNINSVRTYISSSKKLSDAIQQSVAIFCSAVSSLIKIRQTHSGISPDKLETQKEKVRSKVSDLAAYPEIASWISNRLDTIGS